MDGWIVLFIPKTNYKNDEWNDQPLASVFQSNPNIIGKLLAQHGSSVYWNSLHSIRNWFKLNRLCYRKHGPSLVTLNPFRNGFQYQQLIDHSQLPLKKPNTLFAQQHHEAKSLLGQDLQTSIQDGEIRALFWFSTAGTHCSQNSGKMVFGLLCHIDQALSQKSVNTISGFAGSVNCLAISPDNHRIVSGGNAFLVNDIHK